MWLCHADALTKSRHLSLWAEDLPGVQVLLPDQERYGQASGVMGMLMDNPARKPVVLRLAEGTLRLGEGPLAFEHANRPAIDAYWETATAQMPRLWNGPAFLFEDVSLEGGRLSGTGRRTDFATFLYWRDNGRPREVVHITGTSLPVLADGSLFGVRMAAHTANGGAAYFPAGSLDEDDLVDGAFDLTASIARELREETGLAFDRADDLFTAAFDRGAYHIARRSRLTGDFDNCRDMLARHQAETGDDEIEAAVAIRRDGAGLAALKPYARALADWHFENEAFSCSGEG